ncbi:SDR family oxidoreductase [Brevibacterium casei]|nr:SDR family oxidoreductase [Brevibacterium casei]
MAVDLTGRRALVTGGASGLGKAMCESFAEAGATVVVADVDAEAAGAVAEAIGGEAWAVNLADTSALDGIDLEVDILVNNAGIQRIHPIPEFPLEEWRLIMTIMLEAPFVLTSARPGMYERGLGEGHQRLLRPRARASANKSAYVAAKHGLMGLTKTTALEAGPRGVTCNAINPGYVLTPLVKGQIADQAVTNGISEDEVLEKVFLGHSAVPRLAEPEDIAALALFLASDAAAVVTGTAHSIDGGWTAA